MMELEKDEYGEVINSDKNFGLIAACLINGKSIIIGWTDGNGTHYDILFCLKPWQEGMLQGGVRGATDLFVSVMRMGCFGFDAKECETHPGYIAEKLGLGNNVTTDKLTEMINGVRRGLN